MAFTWIRRSEYYYLAMEDDAVLTVRETGSGWEYEVDRPGQKLICPAASRDEAMKKCLEAACTDRTPESGRLEPDLRTGL